MVEGAGSGEVTWNAAREDADSVLRHALDWTLPAGWWDEVASAVADIGQALATTDLDLLLEATGRLELCSPLRTKTRLGDKGNADVPAPKPVRGQIIVVVDKVGRGGKPAPVTKSSGASADARKRR